MKNAVRVAITIWVLAAVPPLWALEEGAEESVPFFRDPAVNHDGSRIAFCYRGDIWTARPDGGDLRRLTSHVAYDTRPSFSPDGRLVAYSSDRTCGFDVYVIPAEGGEPKRLTFH
jgi:Tol biopolymer transport system component